MYDFYINFFSQNYSYQKIRCRIPVCVFRNIAYWMIQINNKKNHERKYMKWKWHIKRCNILIHKILYVFDVMYQTPFDLIRFGKKKDQINLFKAVALIFINICHTRTFDRLIFSSSLVWLASLDFFYKNLISFIDKASRQKVHWS